MSGTKNATRERGFESSFVASILKRTRGRLTEVLR